MAPKASDRFNNFYTSGGSIDPNQLFYVYRRSSSFSNGGSEVVLSIKPSRGDEYDITTLSGSFTTDNLSRIKAFTLGARTERAVPLREEEQFFLVSKGSKNIHVATVSHRGRADYGFGNDVFWLDQDFTARSFTPYLMVEASHAQIPTQYDITTGVQHNMNVKSPNGTRTVQGAVVASVADMHLLSMLTSLRDVSRLVNEGVLPAATVVALSNYNAKDLEDGEEVLLTEIKFRGERETLEKIARLEREALELRSREERKAAVEAELDALKASVTIPEIKEEVTATTKRKR